MMTLWEGALLALLAGGVYLSATWAWNKITYYEVPDFSDDLGLMWDEEEE